MIISNIYKLPTANVDKFCWNNLKRFHNIEYTARRIVELHQLPKKQEQNAKKQARQIRQCLIQASEYFAAAQAVSLATRPVLIYYGILSFALAEILFKQDGMSSLDNARGQHAHYGLDFRKAGNPSKMAELSSSAGSLKAAPLIKSNGMRYGTFELWHRSQRDAPLVGELRQHDPMGITHSSAAVVGIPDEHRAELVPQNGLSLLDCLKSMPQLHNALRQAGIEPSFARGRVSADIFQDRQVIKVYLHAGNPSITQKVLENFKFPPRLVQEVSIIGDESACICDITLFKSSPVNTFKMASSLQYDHDEVLFFKSNRLLNEFGNIYFASFIMGNYARYFPDEWMDDIENNTDLSLLTSELLEFAIERVPLLMLNELTRTYHIN